ncbi:hypothetical protein ELS82_22950 [Vibrio ouci]|uniref:Uncharacterized protein n=1 Tax=Vibrio ouci TaxID=2499078 RepID=A0A4Y8W8S1_9VIBR|nr:hypothetical protein ELS82_22950 [Vibrio ouci]
MSPNAKLSGEQRPTALNKATLNTTAKFATKTAERCESDLNDLLIKCLKQMRTSNKPRNSTPQTNPIFSGCCPTEVTRNQSETNAKLYI